MQVVHKEHRSHTLCATATHHWHPEILSFPDLPMRTVSHRPAHGNTLEKAHQATSLSRQQLAKTQDPGGEKTGSKEPCMIKRSKDPLPENLQVLDGLGLLSARCPPHPHPQRHWIHACVPGLGGALGILGHFPNLGLEGISRICCYSYSPSHDRQWGPNGKQHFSYVTLFICKSELAQTPSKPERERDRGRMGRKNGEQERGHDT